MGKHSASGGGPFERKHQHLSHGGGVKRRSPRTIGDRPTGTRAPGVGNLSNPSSRKNGPLESAPARLRAERDRRRARTKRIIIAAVASVAAVLVAAAAGVLIYLKNVESTMQGPKTEKLVNTLAKSKPQEPYTVLLLGGDDKPGTPQHRTDTMILARIDAKNKQVWMLSIPRDTRVDIPGYGHGKINSAYFHGGAELAVKTVSEFTGVPVNHYMEVDFRGFKSAVDAMGGVWVDVPVEIDDEKAASQSYKKRAAHIDKGYQLLDGEHALTFVRSRAFPDADFSRMRHQQVFFKALADQIASRGNVVKLPKVVSAVAPYIGTDMSLVEMIRTANALKGAGGKNVYTATVAGEWKNPYVWPDEEEMQTLVERMMAGHSFDDSSTIPASGSAAGDGSSVDPSTVEVAVRNGGGIAGCGKQAASILRAQSFNVGEIGNANQFVYDKTLVIYRDDRAAAEKVAASLPPGTKIVESRGMYSFTGDVLVVIGKDWDISKVPVVPVTN